MPAYATAGQTTTLPQQEAMALVSLLHFANQRFDPDRPLAQGLRDCCRRRHRAGALAVVFGKRVAAAARGGLSSGICSRRCNSFPAKAQPAGIESCAVRGNDHGEA